LHHTIDFNYKASLSKEFYKNNLYLVIPIFCIWPARDWSKPLSVNLLRHMRGRRLNDDVGLWRLFTLYYCNIVAVSVTSDMDRLLRYRYLPHGSVWHAQPTLDINLVRGMTMCEVTAMEHGTSCGRSVVGTLRQRSCAVHPTDTAVRGMNSTRPLPRCTNDWPAARHTTFYCSDLEHGHASHRLCLYSRVAVRGGVVMRKSARHSLFC